MPLGGKRAGAGRKPGTKSSKTKEIADRLMASGVTPLEVMLMALRYHTDLVVAELAKGDVADKAVIVAELGLASTYAKDAAPYMHPRLNAVDHSGGLRITYEDSLKAFQQAAALAASIVETSDGGDSTVH